MSKKLIEAAKSVYDDAVTKAGILRMSISPQMQALGEALAECESTDDEGFIPWAGGGMPIAEGTPIDVKYRDGFIQTDVLAGRAGIMESMSGNKRCATNWDHFNVSTDIIAYKVLP